MAVRDIFKVSWKTFFNPAGWIDYEGLKRQNKILYSMLRGLFVRGEPARVETFEEAKARLNLTEEDIQKTATTYRLYALIFLLLGIAIFGYAFFLLFSAGTIMGWLLGLAVSGLFSAQAFRYDFWAFQLIRRQLGATFKEWKQHFLGDKGTST
jgi:intracellular multiplication protein IcmV